MWEEYADSIGVSTNDLTQAQKIQAEYNGIMKETRFQVGDAAAYTRTFSGQVQQLKFNLNQMMVAIGKVVAPIAQLFIPVINGAISAVTNFFNSIQSVLKAFGLDMPDVVSKTSSAMSGVSTDIENTGDSAVSAAKKINKAFAGVDEINVLKTSDSSSSSGGSSSSGSSTGTVSSAAIDTASIGSSVDVIKDKLSELWNSDFIQSFTGAASTYFNFLKDLVFNVGSSIGNNLKNTWSDIQGNLATSVSNMSTLWTDFWNTTKSTIDIYGPSIISTITGLFNSIYTTAIGPIITLIVQAWTDFTTTLSNLWNQYGATILNNIAQFVNNIWQLFQSIYTNIIEPVITPFLEMLSWLWEEHLSKLVESIGGFIAKLVNGALEIYNNFISPIVNFLLDIFGPAWSFVSSLIIDTFGTAFGVVSDILSGIFESLGGVIDFIAGIFTLNWEKAWNGVVSIFKGIIDGLVGIFKAPFNLIIDGINAFIRALNKIKIPDWVPGVGGFGFNIPEIPKLAQGGWFERGNPQLAIVGDNNREAEIVTPESKIYDQVRNAIRDSGGTGKQEIEITIYHKYEDGRTIIQKINQAQIDAGQVLILS